jgi:prepilin-type N-terminal cleavage/methylation domain-containing protein
MPTTILLPRRPAASGAHTPTHRRDGFTLAELATVLLLMGLLSVAGLQALSRLQDLWGVSGASTAVAGLIREARFRAVARGGAWVRLSSDSATVALGAGGTILRKVDLEGDFGVALDLSGAAAVVLAFDPAGVGRMTSRTLRFRRGSVVGRLVVSSYGRVRP